ncbi:MAG: hypothetical protein ABEJ83_01435 [Candidatus Nanohaloarchaea archaeon]
MDLKPLLKEWRIWVLIAALTISAVFLFPHYEQQDNGELALETNIKKGLDLKGGTKLLMSVQSNNTSKEMVGQIKRILEQRVSAFGLTQTSIRTVRLGDEYKIQMEVASSNETRLRRLISQEGSFEARLPLTVQDKLKFKLEKTYSFRYHNNSITVANQTYRPNQTFKLDGTKFYYLNNSESAANLEVVAYSGQDIQSVLSSDAMVRPTGSGHSFRFPVVLSQESAENVKRVAQNYPTIRLGTGQSSTYLGRLDSSGDPAKLSLYVDGNLQSSLNVGAVFKRQVITQPSINGGAPTAAQARQDMQRLMAILQSGQLPAPVKVDSVSTISSSLGSQFMSAAFISIVLSLVAVGALIYVRYGRWKLALPIVITGSSEVFILLGSFFSTLITLDLASIAGIVAAVGTGVDDQIIITDESSQKTIQNWKERLKRAFFVIFTSAASTIGAMSPIVSPSLSNMAIGAAGLGLIGYEIYTDKRKPHHLAIGIFAVIVAFIAFQFDPSAFALQSIRGFALTTILGVLIGISITRPAYAKFLEYLEE